MPWLDDLLTSKGKNLALGGVLQPSRDTINLVSGFGFTDNPGNDSSDLTAVGTGGAGQHNTVLANGANHNVDPAGQTVLRITGPTAAFSIGGFVAPSAPVTLTVINTTSQTMTFVHESGGDTAVNRLDVQAGGPSLSLLPSKKAYTFVYDMTAQRWQLQSTGVIRPAHLDLVQDFGADPTGAVDATSKFQAAINAAVAGPIRRIVVPAGATLMVSSTLTTNGNLTGHGTISTGIEIVCDNSEPGTFATIFWAGAAHGVIFAIREAIHGRMKGIAFDGRNTADVGLQLLHIPSTDGQDIESWVFDQCSFAECQHYDLLIGDVSADGPGAAGSIINCTFNNPRFERSNLGATTLASVFHRSANALSTIIKNPFLDGGNGYPLNGIVVESGSVKVYGGLSQVQRGLHGGKADFYLPTPGGASPQVPGGLYVEGFESQSDQFLEVDPQASATAILPVVLACCNHSDTFGTGLFSIKWNHDSTLASLTVVGGTYGKAVNVVGTQPNVFLVGPSLFTPPTGHTEAVIGSWTAGAAVADAAPWELTPEQFGADPSGVTNSSTAFTNMFSAKDTLGGATIRLAPNATYKLSTAVDMGTAAFVMRGGGWSCATRTAFGSAPTIGGTLIKCTLGGFTATGLSGLTLRGFAIQGPGSGVHKGVSLTGSADSVVVDGMFITQFSTGLSATDYLNVDYKDSVIAGCGTTGIDVIGTGILKSQRHTAKKCQFELNGVGLSFGTGIIDAVLDCEFVSNTTGLSLTPASADRLNAVNVTGNTFLSNTNGLTIDSTNHTMAFILVTSNFFDSGGLNFAGTNTITNLIIDETNIASQGQPSPTMGFIDSYIASRPFLPSVASITSQTRNTFEYEATGTTSTVGGTFVLTIPVPSGTSAKVKATVVGRVTTAGGGASLGDTYGADQIFVAKNVSGTASVVGTAPTLETSADTSQAADTVTLGASSGNVTVTATQLGATNTGTITWRLWACIEVM